MTQYKGLYVDNFSTILGNTAAENKLLTYAHNKGFTTLSLYDLHKILHKGSINAASTAALAAFNTRARTSFGIVHIAGIAENADFFTNVISAYNHIRPAANERIDVYNLEFEFWNQVTIDDYYCSDYLTPHKLPCTTDGAFTFYQQQFNAIHTLAQKDKCVCETYVGWPTGAQAKAMLPYADRVLIHAYVADPATAYAYVVDRLARYANAGNVNIIIIFSAEPEFSGPWLKTHSPDDAFKIFLTKYAMNPLPWKKKITLLGYQWFDYGYMV